MLPWKDPPILNGKIHYFDWAIFNSFLLVHQRVEEMRNDGFCWIHMYHIFIHLTPSFTKFTSPQQKPHRKQSTSRTSRRSLSPLEEIQSRRGRIGSQRGLCSRSRRRLAQAPVLLTGSAGGGPRDLTIVFLSWQMTMAYYPLVN